MANLFIDTLQPINSKRIMDENGFTTIKDCNLTKTGVFPYYAKEIGELANEFNDEDIVYLYRPESEVFSQDSLKSFNNAVVTDGHPSEMISSSNAREHSRGMLLGEVRRHGDFMISDIRITDSELLAKIHNGKQEISNGYTSELVREDGVTPSGDSYQFIQTNIKARIRKIFL